MARVAMWPTGLGEAISRAERLGWGWGGRTCLDLMLDTADAIISKDVRTPVLEMVGGRMPRSRRALLRVLSRLGGLEQAVSRAAECLGFPEIDPHIASAGDWGVADFAGDAALTAMAEGVVRATDRWVFRLPGRGVTSIDAGLAPVRRAWAVG